jgi:hypothetical protein
MSRAVTTDDWRKLSRAARKERNLRKFVHLLKQLYDVVNAGEERGRVSPEAKRHKELRAA